MCKIAGNFLLRLSILFIVACSSTPRVGGPSKVPITILHTNDVHGHAWSEKDKEGVERGGYAAQAKLVSQIWKEVDKKGGITLILSGGDINTGTPESDLLDGEPDVRSMNHIGYDAMVLGNHEFDRGVEKIEKQRRWAKFPFLSANIKNEAGNYIVDPYTVLVRNEIRIGILGLTAGDLKTLVLPKLTTNLSVENPIEAAKKHIPKLQAMGTDILIGLTHIGVLTDKAKALHKDFVDDRKLAKEVPEFDVIVGGHTDVLLESGLKVNDTLIAQAGAHGSYVGRVDLIWDRDKNKIIEKKASVIPVLVSEGVDPTLNTLLSVYKKKTRPLLQRKIARAETFLDGERKHVRARETNLGNLVTDAIRKSVKADIAVYNGGGIRGSIDKGPIRISDIYRVLPFNNTVVSATVSGSLLEKIINHGLRSSYPQGAFLQISGFSYSAKNGKVKSIQFKGKRVKPNDTFRIATNNFLLAGGDGHSDLAMASEKKDTAVPVDRVLIDYLQQKKQIGTKKEKRIQLLGDYKGSSYSTYSAE